MTNSAQLRGRTLNLSFWTVTVAPVIVIAFALSGFLQYDAIALAWLGQFFPEGHLGL